MVWFSGTSDELGWGIVQTIVYGRQKNLQAWYATEANQKGMIRYSALTYTIPKFELRVKVSKETAVLCRWG